MSTAIDFDDQSASLEKAISVAEEFRLEKSQALHIIQEVNLAVKQWRKVATQLGLSSQECNRMSTAFRCD